MERRSLGEALFRSIDDQDLESFASILTEDVLFRYGNAPPVQGRSAVVDVVRSFFESIRSLRHDVVETLSLPGVLVCHGTVTYTRHDASTLTVPFANIMKVHGEQIREYLIFVDASALYSG